MATIPQVSTPPDLTMDSDGNYILPADHRLPGWTVDALLAEGKVDEARAELARLLEDDEDDPGVEGTPEFYKSILDEVRRRADARG